MGSRPDHRVSRSLRWIRTSLAVLRMAPPFSPDRDFNHTPGYSPTARSCKLRQNFVSVIAPRDSGFESQEPTSPKVSCTGHIKIKTPQRVMPSKQLGADTDVEEIGNLSKLKKLLLGKQRKNNKAEEEGTVKGDERRIGHTSLGQIIRNTSDSYEAKFCSVDVEEGPIVAKSECLMFEAVPNEESGIDIWRRRCIPSLKALEVHNNRPEPRDLSSENLSPRDRGL